MKKYILSLIAILVSLSASSQITPKDILGINLNDSTNILTIDSAKVEKKIDEVKKQTKSAYYPGMELHPHLPKSYSIDRSRAVGEIALNTTTNPTGAMVMSVPIEAAKDDKNFGPQLGLAYSNNGGNGPLGMGWTISGVSQITRSNKSMYYDGKTEGIKFSADAAFSIDGNRLIKLSEVSGQTINYQTEQGLIKVTATLNGNTYKSFRVNYPDGSVAIYGYENESSNIKHSYPLTKITDKSGNVINYTYTYISGYYRLDKATYGQSQQASIEFTYNITRSDAPMIYSGGYQISYNYLLSSVTTKYNGNTLKTYSLYYGTTAQVSTLSKIECNVSGKNLNPLIFYYGDNKQIESFKKSDSQMMQWYNYTYAHQLRTTKGKFDYGSENEGIITLPNKNSYAEHYRHSTAFRHSQNWIYNDYAGDESIFITTGLEGDLSGFCPVIKTEKGFSDIFCADLDEFDGEEIIKVNNTISGSYDRVDFHVYTPNLYAGIAKKYTRTFNFNTLRDYRGDKSITPKFYYTGDFLGNGKTQILAVSTSNVVGSGNSTTVYLFDLESNRILYQGSPFNYFVQFRGDDAYKNSDKFYAVDYDGDGKTDLCLIDGSGMKIYKFDVSGTSTSISHVYTASLRKSDLADRDFFPGDFNGDGKADFLLSPTKGGGSTWKIYSSEGDGWYRSTDINITSKIESSRFLVQDVNGDGQTDLIETYGTSDNITLAAYFIADRTYKGSRSTQVPKESIIIPTNINNYNYFSQLISVRNGIASRIAFQADYSKSRLLTGVVSSVGTITKFEYCQLNQDRYGMLYSKGYGAKFPHQNFYGALTVLSATESYNNNVKIGGSYFQYANGILHKQGLGFRGFERIYASDLITGEYNTTIYDPMNYGVIKSDESAKSLVTYNYNVSTASNKIANVTVANKTVKDKAKNISVTSTYTYDTYGNPTREIVDYGGGLKTTTTNTFNNLTTTPYLLGQLSTQTVIKDRSGVPSITTKMERTYSAARLPISTKVYTNSNLTSEEAYAYDTFGNLTESKSKLYTSATWLSTKYTYDSYGRVTRKTDPVGLFVNFVYDGKNQLQSTKNHKGLETKYEYDEQGRRAKVINPDGTIETILFAWTATPTSALILRTMATTGKSTTQTYIDAQGREIRTGELRFDGKYLYTDITYDSRGRIQKTSLPFKGSSASKWNTYVYDSYDRLTTLTYASGKKDTYSYANNSVTETKDNVARTINKDATGNTISIVDPAGTITYKLRADDQLLSIVAPGSITTTLEYDVYGRQTKIIDPSAGTNTVAYDAAGNLSQQTDARGRVTKSTYDTYGRITRKEVVGDLTTTYAYSTDGQLLSVTNSNGTGNVFTYDSQMRISTDRESAVDGKWMQKTFTYANGNTSAIAYSANTGNITTENYFYANGHLSEIKLNNTSSIWKLTQENDLGNMTEALSGGLTRSYGYDANGLPNARVIKKGTGVIQNFSYNISVATGNLNWRKDNTRNIQENFTYDNLNRLTGFGGTSITYDAKGNITNVSTVGKFGYTNAAKPYAVTEVTPYGTAIPLRSHSIAYNGLSRPSAIAENSIAAALTYNAAGDRVKMQIKKYNVDDLTRYYIGGKYEIESGTAGSKEKLYLGGDAYTASAVYVKEGGGAWAVYYLGRDYLGSITHIIDAAGTVKQELSYDPWGRLRNPANQQLYASGSEPALFIARGYTGHEHLPMYGLINMNARLYDPALGRFLSPDPYVQAGGLSQNYNRFSYALNNPLRFTDPNGEFLHIIIGAVVGGVVNWAMHGFQFNAKGLGYFAVGAAAGALTAATGGAASSMLAGGSFSAGFLGTSAALTATSSFINGAIVGAASGLAGGLVSGTGNALVEGQKIGKALTTGLVYGGIGAASGFLVGGVWGGIDAVRDGREFWNGATEINNQTIANQNLPQVQQRGNMNCGPTAGETTTGVSQDTYRTALGGDAGVDGVHPNRLANEITNQTGRRTNVLEGALPNNKIGAEQMATQMRSGSDFILGAGATSTLDHATALNTITLKTFQKINGDLYYKVIYQVMDPANGQYKNIGAGSVKYMIKIFP